MSFSSSSNREAPAGQGRAYLQLAAACACWGASWPGLKLVTGFVEPLDLTFLTLLGSWITVTVVMLFVRPPKLARAEGWTVVLMGALDPGLATILFIAGVSMTTASASSLIDSLQGLITAVLGALFLRERAPRAVWGFLVLAMFGVSLSLHHDANSNAVLQHSFFGNLLVLGGTLSASLFSLLVKRVDLRGTTLAITWHQSVGALLFIAIVDWLWHVSGHASSWPSLGAFAVIMIFALGVVGNGLAFLLFTSGLRQTSLSSGALFLTLIPIVSISVSALILREPLTLLQLVGALVAIVCIALGARAQARAT